MNDEFKRNWLWAESHIEEIKQILIQNSMYLISIRTSTPDEDMKRATDLVITVEGGDVAVRIRRIGYHNKYRDLTLRSYNNGHKTELHKIKEGWGRWYLYLWVGDNGKICDWILVDLNKLREANIWDTLPEKPNTDGTTRFVWVSSYRLKSIGCLVAEYTEPKPAKQLQLF